MSFRSRTLKRYLASDPELRLKSRVFLFQGWRAGKSLTFTIFSADQVDCLRMHSSSDVCRHRSTEAGSVASDLGSSCS